MKTNVKRIISKRSLERIWESFSSVPEQEFTEAVSSHARSSTYYVIVTCLYVTSVTFSIAVAWVIFRRLPLRFLLYYPTFCGSFQFQSCDFMDLLARMFSRQLIENLDLKHETMLSYLVKIDHEYC